MDITEVTVAAFGKAAEEKNKSRYWEGQEVSPALDVWCNARYKDRGTHPMNCVDWAQADTYCKTQGKRLPTEWEWEWAARGREKGWNHPWGDEALSARRVNACGSECVEEAKRLGYETWKSLYSENDGFATTAPVGSKPAGDSPAGLKDMVGNVWEWTSSNDGHGTLRVLRGGGWDGADLGSLRTSFRDGLSPTDRSFGAGFRCARTSL